MKRLTTCLLCILLIFFFSSNLNAGQASPIIYNITISKMEFYHSNTGTWVTVGEGDMTFDIASVNSGSVVGSYISASAIPVGTYTKVRVTLSRNMSIKATDGVNYTTVNQTTSGGETFIKASADSADYAEGTAVIPSTDVHVSGDYYINSYNFSSPLSIQKGITRSARVKFDVTNAATFQDLGGGVWGVYPTEPSVTIDIVD